MDSAKGGHLMHESLPTWRRFGLLQIEIALVPSKCKRKQAHSPSNERRQDDKTLVFPGRKSVEKLVISAISAICSDWDIDTRRRFSSKKASSISFILRATFRTYASQEAEHLDLLCYKHSRNAQLWCVSSSFTFKSWGLQSNPDVQITGVQTVVSNCAEYATRTCFLVSTTDEHRQHAIKRAKNWRWIHSDVFSPFHCNKGTSEPQDLAPHLIGLRDLKDKLKFWQCKHINNNIIIYCDYIFSRGASTSPMG